MRQVIRINVEPCSKPRMTRADKWKKRPSVVKFFAFRDAIKLSSIHNITMTSFEIEFNIAMPKSWSKKKKALHDGSPHLQRPDLDNYIKAWCDSVFQEDSVVWRIKATKRWTSSPGYITINEL
jgi:Holliday junction resolvase RusA-like endonuclease